MGINWRKGFRLPPIISLPCRKPLIRYASPVAAGWSSPVARQAHNLKVAGSNPAPATNFNVIDDLDQLPSAQARKSS
jgi:hypothetical protein